MKISWSHQLLQLQQELPNLKQTLTRPIINYTLQLSTNKKSTNYPKMDHDLFYLQKQAHLLQKQIKSFLIKSKLPKDSKQYRNKMNWNSYL